MLPSPTMLSVRISRSLAFVGLRNFSTTLASRQPKNFSGVDYPAKAPSFALDENVKMPDLFSLKGKVASISGSSGGIGYAIAESYAQMGADVAIWYNSRDPAQKVKYLTEKYGVNVKAYKVPVTDKQAVDDAIEQQIQDFGKIDVFVANAGVIAEAPLADQTEPDWDKLVDVNVKGALFCAQAVGRHFKERGSGSLIFTASMSAYIVNVPQRHGCYNVSKAAVLHLMKNLAVEFAPFARVNSVSPGYCLTDLVHYAPKHLLDDWCSRTPLGRVGLPKEMAGAYVYLASDASSFTTGSDIKVDGGYSVP